jgi:DNA-binding NarL/FixJ family response regulator
VLDCTMPRQGGLEAARELGASGSTTAIVFLSVSDDPAIVTAALDAGAQAYVPKARTATDLLPAIRTALAGRGFVSGRPP